MRATPYKHEKQAGNILFLILLAIVLFVALTYAVNSGMRGGGKDATSEKSAAGVSEMLNYFAQLDTAIQRMMLVGQVKDYELNFYDANLYITGSYDNVNCTEDRCRVFNPNGGAVAGQRSPIDIRKNANGGQGRLFLTSVPGAGTALPDLVMAFMGVKYDACVQINKTLLNLEAPYYNAPANGTLLYYTNPYPAGAFAAASFYNVPNIAGHAGTFCHCIGADKAACEADNLYPTVTHVLIAR